jgi:hypothetical protein
MTSVDQNTTIINFLQTIIMKQKILFGFVAVFMLSLFVTGCSEGLGNTSEDPALEQKNAAFDPADCLLCDFNAVLSDKEKAGLLWMREEEKVARDVYLAFYELYGSLVFKNIAKSEQAHMNAILYLINGYKFTDPAFAENGKFTPGFQSIYDGLITEGKKGLKEALQVAVKIEEMDIADLQKHLSETIVANLVRVYSNLLATSNNHLKAFNFNMTRL